MQFAKHKLRLFPHLIPRPLLLPREAKVSNESQGKSTNMSQKGTALSASLREPMASYPHEPEGSPYCKILAPRTNEP